MNSLYFEDISVGDRFTSLGRTICEADFVNFAGVSGDFSPLHVDEEFGKTTVFGGRIAHGLLTLSVAQGLLSQLATFKTTVVALLRMKNVGFLAPVRVGDTIHAELVIKGKKKTKRRDQGLVSAIVSVKNQRNTKVLTLDYDILVRTRPWRAKR